MISIIDHLTTVFEFAISAAFPSLNAPTVISLSAKFADYQCNSALPIAKLLQNKGLV